MTTADSSAPPYADHDAFNPTVDPGPGDPESEGGKQVWFGGSDGPMLFNSQEEKIWWLLEIGKVWGRKTFLTSGDWREEYERERENIAATTGIFI